MKNALCALLLVVFVTACTRQSDSPRDQVLAKVNGSPITVNEFSLIFNQLKGEQDELSQRNPQVLQKIKTRALNESIILSLLRQECTKKGVRVAKEEVDGRLANWRDGYPPGGFEEMLQKQGITEDFIRRRIEDLLMVEKVTASLFGTETQVSDDEMKNYFKQHEAELVRPERIHAFQIVVPTREEAEKVKTQIANNELTFESAARKYSLSPDSAKGGDLGFFARNEKLKAFNEAFRLTIGTLSNPIQSRYGIHILKVVEKQPKKALTFNEAKEDIVRAVKRLKEVKVYKEWVTKLLKDSEIYRNEALFAVTS